MKLRKASILVVNWVSSLSFLFLSVSTAATYIFKAPNCTTTIISLEPCALNAEYQDFILRFIKMSLLCRYHWKRGYGVKGGPKTWWSQGYFTDNSIFSSPFQVTSRHVLVWGWHCLMSYQFGQFFDTRTSTYHTLSLSLSLSLSIYIYIYQGSSLAPPNTSFNGFWKAVLIDPKQLSRPISCSGWRCSKQLVSFLLAAISNIKLMRTK